MMFTQDRGGVPPLLQKHELGRDQLDALGSTVSPGAHHTIRMLIGLKGVSNTTRHLI